jgi:hypothetical protein
MGVNLVRGGAPRDVSGKAEYDACKPFYDAADKVLHWPVVLLYPQHEQSDLIQDFDERHTLADHLKLMFDPAQPAAPWDAEREYAPGSVTLYFATETANVKMDAKQTAAKAAKTKKNIDDREAGWSLVSVRDDLPLRSIMQMAEYVVPGERPEFFVVPTKCDYHKQFCERYDCCVVYDVKL